MIKKKMKPILLTVVLAITMLLIVAATPQFEVYDYVPPTIEQQFFSTATIEDSFCDRTILVMLTQNATREGHFGLQDFAEVSLLSVECITAGFKNGQRVSGNFRRTLRLTLHNPCKQGVLDAVAMLEQCPDIHIAEPNFYFYEEAICYDYETSYFTTFADVGYIDRRYFWAQDRIGVPQAQAITKGCPSVIVGINDGAIYVNHPSLNHLIKDIGYAPGTVPGNSRHGTNSAGLVSSLNTGVARYVSLVSLRRAQSVDVDIDIIRHAEANGIRIINRSLLFLDLGIGRGRIVHDKIASWDGLYIRSAMNDDRDINQNNFLYPDTFLLPNLITVGASDQLDRRVTRTNINPFTGAYFTSGSNYCLDGIRVCIFAPGTNIRTTSVHGLPTYINGYTNDYGITSAAAPLVAGTAALMWSINPTLTPAQIRTIILDTVDIVDCYSITNHSVAGGRLNTYAAVKAARDFGWTHIYDGYLEGSGHWYFAIGGAGYAKLTVDCSCYECCHHTGIFIIKLEKDMDIELNFCNYDSCWRFVRIEYCGEVLEIIFWIDWGFYFRAYVMLG